MIYETLLCIGALGLLAQTILGMAHGHGHADHGHAGHAHVGHGDHLGHIGHAHGHADHGEHTEGPSHLWSLFSPLTIFSLCVGGGATGLLVRPYLPSLLTALAALAGSVAFWGLVVRPIWTLIFQFASRPARALEGAVAASAEALTRFDARGQGMVRVTIDGQIVRLLARLEPDEVRDGAAAIHPGDRLVVTSVDGRANTCRVSRL